MTMEFTYREFFSAAVEKYSNAPLICIPAHEDRGYLEGGLTLSYQDMFDQVSALTQQLAMAGFGHGHRIAALLGNRPEMMVLKLACGQLGISWVPVNPDYRPAEIAYVLEDSSCALVIVADEMIALVRSGLEISKHQPRCVTLAELAHKKLQAPTRPPLLKRQITAETEASLIYTSGTTGRPKGCILSQGYEIEMGQWYANLGGLIHFSARHTRVYCPLPLFHVNAAILLFFAVMTTGSCQIIPERFSARRWWQEIVETKATAAHYLGVIIPALMNRDKDNWEDQHSIEWAVGAGVEPTLHEAFEARFEFPLIEVWGMTEMCRVLADCHEPRSIHKRAIGRPQFGLDVKVVDEQGREVPRGEPGELTVRHSEQVPRKGAFSGYLNLPEETETAWRTGWFHTGDTVVMDDSDLICFMDRKKNIIRRSGENIAAAEVEACLQEHEDVERVAVIAVPDEMRDEEVLACIQLRAGANKVSEETLFKWAFERLTYYKAPGWITFLEEVPVTGTQKIQKHTMFKPEEDPLAHACDFRALKKR